MPKFDLALLLDRLDTAHVVCVGDAMLDRFIEGAVERISPEAPIPVLSIQREREDLGGAANVARNISALGAQCTLVCAVGEDAASKKIEEMLTALPGVEAIAIAASDRPTAVKTRFISGRAQLLRTDSEKVGPLPEEAAEELGQAALDALNTGDVGALILSDYGKGVLSDALITKLITAAKDKDCPVIVDPKGRDYRKYAGATLVTPNRAELTLASELPSHDDEAVIAACRKVTNDCALGGVLATRSEQGMTLYRTGTPESVDHLSARAREVFDVAGAGDTVVAALASGLAAGLDALDAAAFANRAAGIVVAKTGTAVAYPNEILNDSHEQRFETAEAKVLTLAEAQDRVDAWRRAGKAVGFTNGCFDLLHPGHVSLISQAKSSCEKLILGLNSDASVKRLKGEERPVQDETARANVLAALGDVDMVVVFGEDTPLSLIKALQPDVLVKGADYTKETVVGAQEVESWGGRVVLANLVDGQSTTGTISRMIKSV